MSPTIFELVLPLLFLGIGFTVGYLCSHPTEEKKNEREQTTSQSTNQ